MECPYCKNIFTSKYTLQNHIKTTRYCISKRAKQIKTEEFSCSKCSRSFTSKRWLLSHQNKCGESIDKLKEEIKTLTNTNENLHKKLKDQELKYEEKLSTLHKRIENIALTAISRPTTSNKTQINNYIQQLQPVTDEYLIDNVQHLTIDHIMKGAEGYAQYALEYPLKDRLICVDYARRKVKFKDRDGNVITDPEMSNLATKFFNSIKDKNKELIVEYGTQLKENFGDEVDTIVKIFDYKSDVERGSDGEKSEFHHDFVKQVCSQTIKEVN